MSSVTKFNQWVMHPGGTDLERGMGMCGPEDPLFMPLLPFARVPFQAKESVHKTPLLRKFGNFSINSLNFHPNFSSLAPKFWNFQLTSPQIWKFSAHKPPFSEAIVSSQAPHFENPGRTSLPEKKLSAPPSPGWCRDLGDTPSCQNLSVKLHNKVILLTSFSVGGTFVEFEILVLIQTKSSTNINRSKPANIIHKAASKCGVVIGVSLAFL